MKKFYNVLLNTLVANVTSSYLWFALTFWIYLETKNVMATAIIGGGYMLAVAILSIYFGTIVDHNRKKNVMLLSSAITLAGYLLAGGIYLAYPQNDITNLLHPAFWFLAISILIGGVVETMRNIALSTTVTLLVPKNDRDKANGLVGAAQGISFMMTSLVSGLSIGYLGMGWTLVIAVALTIITLIHLWFVDIPEDKIHHDPTLNTKKIDIAGSIATIKSIPGLFGLIFFNTFNNLIGGAYMALMDPYGLELFAVQVWGIVYAVTGLGFVVGGIVVHKLGLGKRPLRTMLLVNLAMSFVGAVFVLREWWWLYAGGIFVYMCIIPVVEAAEQTVLQRVVPYERQGRVFGFAQSIESAATPITAFAIGPIAQLWAIPYMNSEAGRAQWGWLLGQGSVRGIALVLICSAIIMFAVTLLAFRTKAYRDLSISYTRS